MKTIAAPEIDRRAPIPNSGFGEGFRTDMTKAPIRAPVPRLAWIMPAVVVAS